MPTKLPVWSASGTRKSSKDCMLYPLCHHGVHGVDPRHHVTIGRDGKKYNLAIKHGLWASSSGEWLGEHHQDGSLHPDLEQVPCTALGRRGLWEKKLFCQMKLDFRNLRPEESDCFHPSGCKLYVNQNLPSRKKCSWHLMWSILFHLTQPYCYFSIKWIKIMSEFVCIGVGTCVFYTWTFHCDLSVVSQVLSGSAWSQLLLTNPLTHTVKSHNQGPMIHIFTVHQTMKLCIPNLC